MCSEHIIFMQIVNHCSLIIVGKVWSLQYSYTVCLAFTDHPHKAFGLIDFSRMLVRHRTLLTADADQTPSIGVCRLLGCSGSSAKELERLMKLSLKFGGLTILIAHLLTSRTLGWNPRVLIEETCAHSLFFFSFFFSCRILFSCQPNSLGWDIRMPYLFFFLKIVQNAYFQCFHRVRG